MPLHSNCDDVKRALESCTAPISNYTLPDFRVMVEVENQTCDKEPRAWRVSPGTVTAIIVSPRNEVLPSEFGIDLSRYERREDDEIVGVVHYESRKEPCPSRLDDSSTNAGRILRAACNGGIYVK